MKKLLQIIRGAIFESIVDEAAFRLQDLPESTILYVKNLNRGTEIILYDTKGKKAYACLSFIQRHQYGPDYFVSAVAAEKGYGPFIYELAMMIVYEQQMGLMPNADGDIRGEAWNVWKKFYHREDVIKKTRPIEDEYFSFRILEDVDDLSLEEKIEWFEHLEEPEELENVLIFNTAFSMPPDKQYEELVSRAETYIKKGGNTDTVENAAEKLWNEKYD